MSQLWDDYESALVSRFGGNAGRTIAAMRRELSVLVAQLDSARVSDLPQLFAHIREIDQLVQTFDQAVDNRTGQVVCATDAFEGHVFIPVTCNEHGMTELQVGETKTKWMAWYGTGYVIVTTSHNTFAGETAERTAQLFRCEREHRRAIGDEPLTILGCFHITRKARPT